MSETLVMTIIALCLVAVAYHHVGYPLLLKMISRKGALTSDINNQRSYIASQKDLELPSITVIVPAYNEEQWIAEKIRNLASVDYPRKKLRVLIYCDGCSDNTASIAEQTVQEAFCSDTHFEILNEKINRGKIAAINDCMKLVDSDICALSDVSSLISIDALLIAAKHFDDQQVGVVNSGYYLLNEQYSGEANYWRYQRNIKSAERTLGATIGCHGAFYLFRTHLFEPLAADTINDDFILPMTIVQKHYRAQHEPLILAIEMEPTDEENDFKRRLRISAGNMQQTIRLWRLFNPKYVGVAFAFFSGKGLRLLTPYLLITMLLLPLLCIDNIFMQLFLLGQLSFYIIAAVGFLVSSARKNKLINFICYFVAGHSANLIGGWQYLTKHNPDRV